MKKKFVDEYHWIEEDEMLDFTAIAQSAPDPIALNGATFVGIFALCLFLLQKCKASPVFVMLLAGILKLAFAVLTL